MSQLAAAALFYCLPAGFPSALALHKKPDVLVIICFLPPHSCRSARRRRACKLAAIHLLHLTAVTAEAQCTAGTRLVPSKECTAHLWPPQGGAVGATGVRGALAWPSTFRVAQVHALAPGGVACGKRRRRGVLYKLSMEFGDPIVV